MMDSSPPIAHFTGPVSWTAGPGLRGITLLGRLAESGSTPAQLSLIDAEAVTLPTRLTDAVIEPADAAVVVRSGSGEWRIACRSWQLHRDVGRMFYTAIAPRPTPWTRRLTWWLLLGVAGTAAGHRLLARSLAKKSNRA